MSELGEKVRKSIERLKLYEPEDGYYLAFSGGKDSVTCKALMDMAGVKYDATYRVTSVDPPELVRFIKEVHPDVRREVPRYSDGKPITMWNLIPRKLMPPTRLVRYCCDKLKESGGDGRIAVTGVRWAESVNRKRNQGVVTFPDKNAAKNIELVENKDFSLTILGGVVLTNDNTESRRVVESCYKRHRTMLNPIIEWEDRDVWNFIRAEGVPFCELYNEGYTRLGCIGCPMAGQRQREKEFLRWPKYKDSYLHAFAKMIEERRTRGKLSSSWRIGTTARDVFNWWMQYDVLPGQLNLFEDYDETEGENEP